MGDKKGDVLKSSLAENDTELRALMLPLRGIHQRKHSILFKFPENHKRFIQTYI